MKGLVLEGGGAKGAFQIGAYKALREYGYEFDGVTGTSIGSLNGAMICQNDFEKLEKIWTDINPEEIFGEKLPAKLIETELSFDLLKNYSSEIKDLVFQGGIDIKPIYEYITMNIDEEKMRKSKMDFGLVTYNLSDWKSEKLFKDDIPEGELCNYLMASCYLPVFKRSELGGKIYLDGGFADNLPFSMLLDKGYTELVLVRNNGFGVSSKPDEDEFKFLEINPRHDLGKLLDFSSNNSRRLIKLGYMDTLVSLGVLHGDFYSIKGDIKEFTVNLFTLPDEKISELALCIGLPAMEGMDKLYMYILPRLAEILNIKNKPSSSQIALKLLETRMKNLQMDYMDIYEIEELNRTLRGKLEDAKPPAKAFADITIDKIKNIFYKEDLIHDIVEIIFE